MAMTPEQKAEWHRNMGSPGVTAQMFGAAMDDEEAKEKAKREATIKGNLAMIPELAKRESIQDPTGKLTGAYGLLAQPSNVGELDKRLGGIQLDKRGLEAIRTKALGTGPSAWANLMMQKQGLEESGAIDQGRAEGRGAQAQAMSDLSMRGGLGAGSRERLAASGMQGVNRRDQETRRAGQFARLGIQTSDEEQKNQLLSQLPGMEIAALQPELQKTGFWANMAGQESGQRQQADQFNIANQLAQKQAADEYEKFKADQARQAYGAERTAQVTENAGK